MRHLFRLALLTVMAAFIPSTLVAQTEMSDELFSDNKQPVILELKNIERLLYTVYVDANQATTVEGFKLNPNKAWSRTDERMENRTVILDGLESGLHTIIIEATQDPHARKAQRREEYLTEYEPLIFTLFTDSASLTTHSVDVHASMKSKIAAEGGFAFSKETEKRWQSTMDRIGDGNLEIRVRQYRQKDKIGRVKQRLDSKGMWDKAKKYIHYADIQIFMDGRALLDLEAIAYSGRIEYRSWDYLEGRWWDNHFLHNTIKDKQRIPHFVKNVQLNDTYELRMTAYDQDVSYAVVRTGALPQIVSAQDD